MTDHPTLKPCAHCGSVNGPKLWDSISKDFPSGESHWVYCGGCGIMPAHRGTRADAVAAWNRRAPIEITEDWRDGSPSAVETIQAAANQAAKDWQHRDHIVVTDEMVERAVRAWWRSAHPNTAAENFVDPCEIIWMRAALAAALGQA